MNIKQVEENVESLVSRDSYDSEFIYDLMLAYGIPKTSISRLRKGTYNLSKFPGQICWKKKVLFKEVDGEDLYLTIDTLDDSDEVAKHLPRFIVVTNYDKLLAKDTKTKETLDIPIKEIDHHYTFFLPWAGMEKSRLITENPADVKAAEKMAKLYDEIVKSNAIDTKDKAHALNVFFSRLLFCFFAEDTKVFSKGQFSGSIASHTQSDGSDMDTYLDELFAALDIESDDGKKSHIAAFPYVNGGLFRVRYSSPTFTRKARELLLECGGLDWSQINPDIFGSMIQAVVHKDQRASLGMHYTSVENIMKVINPLFLDELKEQLEEAGNDEKKLVKLLNRLHSIKVFDPACGSGNFLIIAYKEMREIEHEALARYMANRSSAYRLASGMKLENFYGIEIDDFAHEVAILSLWLAKHQMNIEFERQFGMSIPLIPLKDIGSIKHGNAARIDWNSVCPNNGKEEIYLIGNPPYQGAKLQGAEQKIDYNFVFKSEPFSKNLDYISLWFVKGADYVNSSKAQLAFVSTNSICQGDHVGLLWPHIYMRGVEIGFAHTSFKWSNNAKRNAGVTCIIVCLRSKSQAKKYLYIGGLRKEVQHINAYLAASSQDAIVASRRKPISKLPIIVSGSMPRDGGNLILSKQEKNQLLSRCPEAKKYLKKYIGSQELIQGIDRYCIWINESDAADASKIPFISERLQKVAEFRKGSKAGSTEEYSKKPHRFVQISYESKEAIVLPLVSSERREYIPMEIHGKDTVVSNLAFAIYDAEPYVFGLVASRMSMVWTRAIGGQMETRIRYSAAIVYNNFPVPTLNEKQKEMITNHVYEVLDAREKYPQKTLSELYDPNKMPKDLLLAHQGLDEVVELCYRQKPFASDEERLAHLFKLYETMIKPEKGA